MKELRGRIYDNSQYTDASSLYPKWARQVEQPYFSVWVNNLFFLPVRKISLFSGQKGYEYFDISLDDCEIYLNELNEKGQAISTNPLTGCSESVSIGTFSSAIFGTYTDLNGYTSAKGVLFDFSELTIPSYFSITFVIWGAIGASVTYTTEFFKSINCVENYVLFGAKNYQSIALNQDAGGVISYGNNIPSTDILGRGKFTGSPTIVGATLAAGDLRFQYSFLAVEGFLTEGDLEFTKKVHSDLMNITESAEVQQTVMFVQAKSVPDWVRNEVAAICAGSLVIAIEDTVVGGFTEFPYEIFTAKFAPQRIGNLGGYALNLELKPPKINQYPHG